MSNNHSKTKKQFWIPFSEREMETMLTLVRTHLEKQMKEGNVSSGLSLLYDKIYRTYKAGQKS